MSLVKVTAYIFFFFFIKTEQCAKWQTVIFVAILVKDKLSKIKLHQQRSPVCESFKLFLIHISQSNLGHELVFSNLYSKLCSLKYNIATFLWILAITAICLRPCLLDIKKMIHATNLWHLTPVKIKMQTFIIQACSIMGATGC